MESDEQEGYEWQKIKDEITCSICADFFTDPKTAPCLHTFCKICLEKSIEMNKKVACCPLCRAELTQDDVTLIPTNFGTKRLVEIYNQQEERRKSVIIARQRHLSSTASTTISGDVALSTSCMVHPRVDQSDFLLCTAKYSYLSRGENELGFEEGDQLYVMSTEDPDWWLAQSKTSAQVGYVPSNYVTKNANLIEQNMSPQQDMEMSHSADHPIYIAKFSYSPRRKTELGFKEGDKLFIINTDDPDRWLGKNKDDFSGQVGYIPSNYVVEFEGNQLSVQTMHTHLRGTVI